MRAAAVVLLLGAALSLSGCQYLFGPGAIPAPIGGSFDPGFPPFPDASGALPSVTFTKGTATITIAGEAVTLDRMSGSASIAPGFGEQAGWTDGHGWYVQVFAADTGGPVFGGSTYLSLDRIVDGHHWSVADPTHCDVTVDRSDKTGIAGSASCKGVRWADLMAGYDPNGNPSIVEGQAPFDATITFEATP